MQWEVRVMGYAMGGVGVIAHEGVMGWSWR